MFLVVRALTCGIGLAMPCCGSSLASAELAVSTERTSSRCFHMAEGEAEEKEEKETETKVGWGGLRFEWLVRAEKVSLGRSKDIVWSHETRGIKKTKFVEFDWEGVERVEILYWMLLEFGE